MNNIVQNIRQTLIEDNDIFGQNGFVYNNSFEFVNGGVSDMFVNLFYIRPANAGPAKHRITRSNPFSIITTTTRYRAVFQLSDKIDCATALSSLMGQVADFDEVSVVSYSDDSGGIYFAEYNKQKEMDGFNLISIDFDVISESYPVKCDCLTMELCQ